MKNGNLKFKIIFLAIMFFGVFGMTESSKAATISVVNVNNQPSCERVDVSTAINAANEGDTVVIPIGTCIWNNGVTITNKAISIIGADRDGTVIIDATDGLSQPFMIATNGKQFRLSNMTLGGNPNDYTGHIKIGDSNYRIDHITFTTSVDRVAFSAWGSGLIDHCTFGYAGRVAQIFGAGATTWSNSSSYAPGTSAGVYFEDCAINTHAIDALLGYEGAIYVLRYSAITSAAQLDVHGADSSNRSGLYIEIYKNTFSNSGPNYYTAINMRGGSAIIYDNIFEAGKYSSALRLINYRTCYDDNYLTASYHASNKNECNALTTNPLDGNIDNGWPCKDQIGRGPNQGSYPSYEWNNKWSNGNDIDFSIGDPWGCANPSMSDHIKSGRDYFNDTVLSGYSSYVYPHPYITDCVHYPILCDAVAADTTPPAPPSGLIIM